MLAPCRVQRPRRKGSTYSPAAIVLAALVPRVKEVYIFLFPVLEESSLIDALLKSLDRTSMMMASFFVLRPCFVLDAVATSSRGTDSMIVLFVPGFACLPIA